MTDLHLYGVIGFSLLAFTALVVVLVVGIKQEIDDNEGGE